MELKRSSGIVSAQRFQIHHRQLLLELLSPEFTGDTAELQWTSFPTLDHPDTAFYSSANADGSLFTDNICTTSPVN
jgi:hypothetical protein